MTDDIVTRLRDYLAIVDHAFVWHELSGAADEIERLRSMLAHGLTQGSTCEGCPICEELKAFYKELTRND